MTGSRLKRRVVYGAVSFLAGVVVLLLLSTFQKVTVGAPLHWKGYIVPFLFGGALGGFIGMRQLRLTEIAEELRTGRRRYRVLFEYAADGIVLLDSQGRIVECNDHECELRGLSKDRLLGRHVTDSMTPDSRETYIAAFAQLEKGLHTEGEVEIRRNDGEIRHVWHKGVPLTDDKGRFNGVLEYSRDITERRRMEAAYRKESDFCTSAIKSLPGILYVFDERGRYLRWNKSFERDMGYSAEEIARMTPLDFVVPRDRAAASNAIESVFAVGEATAEVTLAAKDGRELSYFHTGVRTEIDGVPCIVGVGMDITERKRAEEEGKRLEMRVQHAQKLESLGVLAGGIAHDFNNLLVGILGHAGLAKQDTPPDSHVGNALQQIEIAARRAADLANQMLAYAGKGHFRVESLDVNTLVEEMAHLLKASISKKATLELDLAADLPPVNADATQIRQVVMNLITNASDALGDESGHVRLCTRAERVDHDRRPATYPAEELNPGDYVVVEVTDTGAGMDRATLARVFDPFYSTKPAGRGLGLASVIGIARSHKGGIRVNSTPGQGTTFTVYLPQGTKTAVDSKQVIAAPAAAASTDGGSGVVLVADDEEVVRSVASMSLQRGGYQVITACDGADAVRVFSENAGQIRAVLLDMAMPILGGEEVFRALRERRPDVPILLTSGYDGHDTAGRLAGDANADFIQKPYTPNELVAKLAALLAR